MYPDPLQEHISESVRGAKRGFLATLRHLFSFTSVKFLLVLVVFLGFGITFFNFGVFGGTQIGLTLFSNPDLARGEILHWTFDGENMVSNVRDSSGGGNTGYLSGFTSTTTVPGTLGQALQFDGSNDSVTSTLSETVRTVAFWVKGESTTEKILTISDNSSSDWYDSNYSYCRELTMTAGGTAGVATTTTNGMAFVATSTLSDLRATSSAGKVEKLNAANEYPLDVVFVAGDNCNTNSGLVLDFGWEEYASTTGAYVVWIEPTDISSTTAKSVLMYYGNPNATDQSDMAGVWDGVTDWVGVYNLAQDPTGTILDSTSLSNDLTSEGSMTASDLIAGQLNGAIAFDGTDDRLGRTDDADFDPAGSSLTVYFWARPPNADRADTFISKRQNDSPFEQWNVNMSANAQLGGTGQLLGFCMLDESFNQRCETSTADNADGNWHNYVWVARNSPEAYFLYQDSAVQATTINLDSGGYPTVDNTDPLYIANANSTGYFDVDMDDVRIAKQAVDPMDLLTYYNNTSDSAAFWTIGAEETRSGIESLEVIAGTLTANDFSSPTIYIDGVATSTVPDTNWHHVVVTTAGGHSVTEFQLGQIDGVYFGGYLDDVRFYDRVLSAEEVSRLHGLGATTQINTTFSSGVLGDGLVGHWTFDGAKMVSNVADSSSEGNHGGLSGFTSTTTVPGVLGQGLSFDGSNDRINIPDDSSLNVSTSFTVGMWVKYDVSEASRIYVSGSQANYWSITQQSQKFAFTETSIADNVNNTTLTLGKWHHIVAVKNGDGSNNVTLYLDGVADGTASVGSVSAPSGVKIISESGFPFDGGLDDVRIYNRALSAEEVKRLYGLGATTKISVTQSSGTLGDSLVGHWTLDGKNLYTHVADSSGKGTKGYLRGISATSSAVGIGQLGQALSFDGTDDYVELTDNSNVRPSLPFTIAGWAKRDSSDADDFYLIAWSINGYQGYMIRLASDGSVYTRLGEQFGGCSAAFRRDYVSDAGSFSQNTWVHIVHVARSLTDRDLYINGVEVVGTSSGTADVFGYPSSLGSLRMGGGVADDGCSAARIGKGLVDDVRIYNRALSAEEVTRLYNLGR